MANGTSQSDNRTFSQLWTENHGNLLLGFLAIIILIGCALMIWPDQQKTRDPFLIPGATVGDQSSNPDGSGDDTENGLDPDMSLLLVKILGLKNDRGVVRIAIYNDPTTFNDPESALDKGELLIQGTEASWEVKVPANQPVAIAAYHDQNLNGILDNSIIGLPVEKYGFSMGERSPRGPPSFEEAAFTPLPGPVEVPIQIW